MHKLIKNNVPHAHLKRVRHVALSPDTQHKMRPYLLLLVCFGLIFAYAWNEEIETTQPSHEIVVDAHDRDTYIPVYAHEQETEAVQQGGDMVSGAHD